LSPAAAARARPARRAAQLGAEALHDPHGPSGRHELQAAPPPGPGLEPDGLRPDRAARSTSVSMLVWSQTAPSGTHSAACPITARTAAVSVSIVITNAASRTASA